MTYPAIPDVPACWTWELPPLPQPAHRGPLVEWQADRCAVCAYVGTLVEDHDHETGDTRGFLCPRCNTAEGQRWAPPVFALYRDRHPTAILGVPVRYGCTVHPRVRAAENAWESALESLGLRAREAAAHRTRVELAESLGWPAPFAPAVLTRPRTSLELAAERVGLTQAEWWETLEYRRDVEWDLQHGDEPRPHPLHERLRIRGMFGADAA